MLQDVWHACRFEGKNQAWRCLLALSFMLAGTFLSHPPTHTESLSSKGKVRLHPEKVLLQIHEPSPSLARISFGSLHLPHYSLILPWDFRHIVHLDQYAMDKDRDAERADTAVVYSTLKILCIAGT